MRWTVQNLLLNWMCWRVSNKQDIHNPLLYVYINNIGSQLHKHTAVYWPRKVRMKPVSQQAARPIFQPSWAAATASIGRPRRETSSSHTVRFISSRLKSLLNWRTKKISLFLLFDIMVWWWFLFPDTLSGVLRYPPSQVCVLGVSKNWVLRTCWAK